MVRESERERDTIWAWLCSNHCIRAKLLFCYAKASNSWILAQFFLALLWFYFEYEIDGTLFVVICIQIPYYLESHLFNKSIFFSSLSKDQIQVGISVFECFVRIFVSRACIYHHWHIEIKNSCNPRSPRLNIVNTIRLEEGGENKIK